MDYSQNSPIWPGSSSFTTGSTPFGYFDADPVFQAHADKFAKFAANTVGYPIMDVELQAVNFYTAFEAAVIEYSNQVNQVNIVNNLSNLLGAQTASNLIGASGLTGKVVGTSLSYIVKLSKAYGTEAESGGTVRWHSASFDVIDGIQTYSIRNAVSASLGFALSNTSSIEIRRVLHQPPPAIVRYFDPFVGTGLGSQGLLDAFDFGGFSPSVNFMMMPIHADLLRIQGIEFNDMIRKSHFSFDIHGDDIRIYPVPGTQGTAATPFYGKVWFEYLFEEQKNQEALLFGNTAVLNGVVSDASNIPYTYQQYGTVNDMGRAWILRYGVALVKEMLGYVRNKYSSVPIPNGEVTLNGSDLVSQGQTEKGELITQLREFLDKMTKEQMLTRQNAEATQMNELLAKAPLRIYIG
ncbi:hypothetical protein UFOVP723_195 [uncultured Caudovirales phage]|uniref:Uncharacterized protein n=1 Tax=uncultured Caudovirales phage TaxID=2100421 RepID=A0A6J5NS23_9CAUD|nr:hypothetical protein UFOVP723_195 [uncultured Caudovirales phage]